MDTVETINALYRSWPWYGQVAFMACSVALGVGIATILRRLFGR